MTKRTALYARVSTANSGQDPACQLNELREHATRMGWEIVEYIDQCSGRRESRPAFDEMMQAVRSGRIHVVCTWRLDRLSRAGVRHAINVLGEFADYGVEYVSLRDGLNFTGHLAMAMYALVAALAAAEADALRERTIAGIANARLKGKVIGRPRLGSASIDQMLELKQQGFPQHQIAKKLGVSRAYVSRTLNPPKVTSGD